MWISIHDTVFGPKLMGLSKALGCSRNEALGLLATFWLWGAKNANLDGMILNYDKDDIARELIAGLDERYTGKQAMEKLPIPHPSPLKRLQVPIPRALRNFGLSIRAKRAKERRTSATTHA